MKLDNKTVLVFGTGLSGISAVHFLEDITDKIIVYDTNASLDIEAIREKLTDSFTGEIVLGELKEECLETVNLAVLSPGVPTDLPVVNRIREKNIPIWGEVELAYYKARGKIAAITGTNGKTTTTSLVGDIMRAYFEEVFVVGNIGIPYTDIACKTSEASVTVIEMSSFQLETIVDFRPQVSAILNITPDHLNRHHTMENYIAAKLNIAKNQGADDVCILNYEDEVLREAGKGIKTNVLYFSSLRKLEKGIYLEGDNIIYSDGSNRVTVVDVTQMNIFGRHNYENTMAAIGIALSLKVPVEAINKAVRNFIAVEHRIEFVTTKNGVKYYNDSKGTNPDASIKAIESMPAPTCLIAGGYDKGSEYDEWMEAFKGKIKALVLIGQTKDKIAETARNHGFHDIYMTDSLQEAVEICHRLSQEGDCVLLSPACASWDMFPNYEERGRLFKEYVRNL
ncbi:UDP-N-acetylmuramoyl-L-alanine--D-glutamate ligase [Anaerocolumna sp. AGMB13020]|uniref:UDP-N-acetylmuramoyl-L-alanine--D-glutamate ligase n=1 Tax=Anaerocolumna sp. AGMB13020 TaxID=3081750 RepID=UPI0029540479|nr:UDP-N-acetylmuramoyl-L-alanine--D-glutamate ligase [Anaerocolumna sp. AGMB13020]WOO36508.1 UDP-N-acetylmuramoyl-L-alanine--D-glutamate ligase [Anaerocolumna sp. AGMB13020]